LGAVTLNHTDLTGFVVRHPVRASKAVIGVADHSQLSARDSLRVNDENSKLLKAGSIVT
jgi:hypothetical protein